MDDQTQKSDLQRELDELLAEMKKSRHDLEVKSRVLLANADRLTETLDRTDFSDLADVERKAGEDLAAAAAEEIASLELEEEKDRPGA
jgi:hypothetical protein